MNEIEFQKQVESDEQLLALLNEAAQNSGLEMRVREAFFTGLEPLAVWACYALFRWSQMVLDARQRNLELDAAQRQIELINKLVAEGWTREQAEKLVPSLLDGIKARQDDPAFKIAFEKALSLVGSAK